MTRSTKTGAFKTLATASIAVLALTACGNDSTPAAGASSGSSDTFTEEITNASEESQAEKADGPRDTEFYSAALEGVAYDGEELYCQLTVRVSK